MCNFDPEGSMANLEAPSSVSQTWTGTGKLQMSNRWQRVTPQPDGEPPSPPMLIEVNLAVKSDLIVLADISRCDGQAYNVSFRIRVTWEEDGVEKEREVGLMNTGILGGHHGGKISFHGWTDGLKGDVNVEVQVLTGNGNLDFVGDHHYRQYRRLTVIATRSLCEDQPA